MRLKQAGQAVKSAEETVLELIAFILSDADQTERLVALTGIGRDDLQAGMSDPQFQAAIFDYALGDEALIVKFAESIGQRPETIVSARRKLPGAEF